MNSKISGVLPQSPSMSHSSYVGKRADKVVVKAVLGRQEYTDADGNTRVGVAKDVERYTVTCDECDSVGRYDERGEIICEGCGMVLSGESKPVLRTEYSGEGDIGKTRGLEKENSPSRGSHDPAV